MFRSLLRLFFAVVITAVHISSVSSFQPGSDYDAFETTNLYNCTGHIHASNVTLSNAFDTLPQIRSCARDGWEQWSLFLHGTFPMLLRWNQGDPSSSTPAPAQFDILIVDVNRTTVQGKVIGNLSYTDGKHIKQIAIGDNLLTWDSDALWYNVSVSVDGYHLRLDSFSATLDAFHPNVAFHNGLLDQPGNWFGSVPLLRGQVVGNLYTPSKQNISLGGLTVMRHTFSENPLPSYIKKYTGGTIWGYSTTFYDSYIFYQTETNDGTVHEAAFLGRALPIPDQRGGFSSAWATYAVTDDPRLYHLSIDPVTKGINTSFSGCANANDIPYLFNVTTSSLLAEFTDLSGGRTSYYSIINGTTTAPFNGVLTNGTIAGIIEEYEAPSRNGSAQARAH